MTEGLVCFTRSPGPLFTTAFLGKGCSAVKKDRKSTRLNSSHRCISYAVFCLKKKKSYPGSVSPRTDCGLAPDAWGRKYFCRNFRLAGSTGAINGERDGCPRGGPQWSVGALGG